MTKNQLTIKDSLKQQEGHFAELLKASGTDVARFMNNAMMAASDFPEIQSGEVDRASVFKVCSRAANDGVVLDGKQAAMVIGWNGKTRQKEAQYRLMAGGVMAMINRSPDIKYIACQLVYEGDDCVIDFVTDDKPISHTINLRNRRGDILGVYAVAKLTSGEWTSPEYMSVDEVNEVRDNYAAKSKDGSFSKMWTHSWGEAARKTILHRFKKRLPLGESVEDALNRDDPDYDMDDITPEPEPKQKAKPSAKRSSKQAVKDAVVSQAEPEPDADGVIDHEPEVFDAEFEEEPPM